MNVMDQFDFSYRDELIISLSCLVHNHQAFAYKCVKLSLFSFSHPNGFSIFFFSLFENYFPKKLPSMFSKIKISFFKIKKILKTIFSFLEKEREREREREQNSKRALKTCLVKKIKKIKLKFFHSFYNNILISKWLI
jgi:hypothetical protein